MRALVLTYDRYRLITEHMLKTYSIHWPNNKFIFRIPYQEDTRICAHGQAIELVQMGSGIKETVRGLLQGIPDDEWVFWCLDDKFLIAIDENAASYFSNWLSEINDPLISGLCFCRARRLLLPDTVNEIAKARTARGDPLLLRLNYNQIWLHQFLRARVVRALFDTFPDINFKAEEMDIFKNKQVIPHDTNLYVTERNYAVFGESTVGGKLTKGCMASMQKFAVKIPLNFEVMDMSVVIGDLGSGGD